MTTCLRHSPSLALFPVSNPGTSKSVRQGLHQGQRLAPVLSLSSAVARPGWVRSRVRGNCRCCMHQIEHFLPSLPYDDVHEHSNNRRSPPGRRREGRCPPDSPQARRLGGIKCGLAKKAGEESRESSLGQRSHGVQSSPDPEVVERREIGAGGPAPGFLRPSKRGDHIVCSERPPEGPD